MEKRHTHVKPVFVSHMAAISSLGDSLDEMLPPLYEGESAINDIKRFSTEKLDFHKGASISWLDSGDYDNRICELTRRLLSQIGPLPEDTYILWTGIKGDVEFIESKANGKARTDIYLAGHYRKFVSEILGIKNRGMEINAACASSTMGLALGAQLIASELQTSVLVCGADILSRFSFTGFAALRGLTSSVCRPFDGDRDGLILGDGAAALLLTDEKTAQKKGLFPKARLSGWGIANDANHITGPARDARGLIKAIKSAMEQAGISDSGIEAYCGHGTGTVFNDAMELTAVETIFASRKFPLFSIKGSIGHTLGAAGAIESAICISALNEKKVPATAGFANHEERTVGRVLAKPQKIPGNNILTSNSGFGGCNAALIFERM